VAVNIYKIFTYLEAGDRHEVETLRSTFESLSFPVLLEESSRLLGEQQCGVVRMM